MTFRYNNYNRPNLRAPVITQVDYSNVYPVYDVPFANLVRRPNGFPFSFRHTPYDKLSQQDYYDWLTTVSTSLAQILPDLYNHVVDLQSDTIGTLEAFILVALAKVKPTDTDTIRILSTSDVWQSASQYSSIMNTDLRSYIFRLSWMWPNMGKPQYLTVLDVDDRLVLENMEQMRQVILERALAELTSVVPDPPVTIGENDRYVPAVQTNMLLALLARLQYNYQVAVNVASEQLSSFTDTISKWRKRFQLITPELLMYLQRSRFADRTKTLVPLTTPPLIKQNIGFPAQRLIWLPTGEPDYQTMYQPNRRSSIRSPQYVAVPIGTLGTYGNPEIEIQPSQINPLPVGTFINPASSVSYLAPAGTIYNPSYTTAYGSETTQGRPFIVPRPAFVRNGTATLLGGNKTAGMAKTSGSAPEWKEPTLFGYDANSVKKPARVGGSCLP